MKLSEEYCQRHSLNVPVVNHTNYNAVFIRRTHRETISWQVLQIRYMLDNNHPSTYSIETMAPTHNAHGSGRHFEIVDSKKLEWDEYEGFFLDWINTLPKDFKVPSTQEEVALVGWEMFCFGYDAILVPYATKPSLITSLDVSLDTHERYKAYLEFNLFAKNTNVSRYLSTWTSEVGQMISSYGYWITTMQKTLKDKMIGFEKSDKSEK